jgi:ethanolamine ammonia-lyase small subunit
VEPTPPSPASRPPDPWHRLRDVSPARIALGRAGGSLPTRELLNFSLAHAVARDAVHQPFDPDELLRDLDPYNDPHFVLASGATDRQTYLLRPDLGRQLADESLRRLTEFAEVVGPCDVSIVLSDGLSALAAHRQIPPLVKHLLPLLVRERLTIAVMFVVPFARVAIQDTVGQLQRAKLSLILLGERPGRGAPDSLGAYLVYHPRPGNTDADRNCVSNIRPEGLPPAAAADLLHYLITQALCRRLSGVRLKDERLSALP